jgi:hypothetical protein
MAEGFFDDMAAGARGLRAFLVIAMPDCLLYTHWARAGSAWSPEDASGYFGDLVRANRQGLRAVGAWPSDMQVTVEGADALVVLREMGEHFVLCALFEHAAPLGMVRLQLKMLVDKISLTLPKLEVQERSRGVRLIAFIERYAPDPHAALLRVATRTGVSLDLLHDPARLDDGQVRAIEEAARRILGLEEVHV